MSCNQSVATLLRRNWFVAAVAIVSANGCQQPSDAEPPANALGKSDKTAEPVVENNNSDLRTVTLFHHRLNRLCVHPSIAITYSGPLSRQIVWDGIKKEESEVDVLCWAISIKEIADDPGRIVFKLRARTVRDRNSVAVCTVKGAKLFLHVTNIEDNGGLNEKPFRGLKEPNIANMTISDLIQKIAD